MSLNPTNRKVITLLAFRYLRNITAIISLIFMTTNYLIASTQFDIVYVKQPRNGDDAHIHWPEVINPARLEPNSDLMLLHPNGTEETLVDTVNGAVTDPFVSFDGKWVYYSLFHDVRPERLNYQRKYLPKDGADIFKINLETREIIQLTFQEFTPNTASGNWDESNPVDPPSAFNRLGYGIINSGPAPIAGGKIIFSSSRNGFRPVKSYTTPNMQLFVMDENGKNITPIAPMSLGSALHPTPLMDGRVMFSSYESQGLRDQRLWGIWSIWPDGRKWSPVVSAFKHASAFHFMTQLSNGDLVVEDYYNQNNFGFGALYRLPSSVEPGAPVFHSAFDQDNPSIIYSRSNGERTSFKMPFTPKGLYSITPLTSAQDRAAPLTAEGYSGKFTHPSAAPNNDLLVVWSGGPVNKLNRPTQWPAVDSGIYLIPNANTVETVDDLVLIKNDPNFNEAWPRAVVSYQSIYGIEQPELLPWLPNDGTEHSQLPKGTAYGLVGSSSFYKRESFPGKVVSYANAFDDLDAFNTSQNNQSSNWYTQGSDAGLYDNSEIWAVRIIAMEPNTDRGYGPHSSPNGGVQFYNHANERLRILGEIPLRKYDETGALILDPEGNPDTSFLAKIPADTPFTFQTINKFGMALNISQTWHQVRPGETRTDCGGCHAHSQTPLLFEQTAAAKAEYEIKNLAASTSLIGLQEDGTSTLEEVSEAAVNVEFHQDIRPILQRSCIQCHTQSSPNPPASLVLDDYSTYDGFPGDYKRLCNDRDADWGIPPVIKNGTWRQTNASRYVRKFQSRRSLLIWKIFGGRFDGWTNEDHPTESVAGDASTLPEGANSNDADIDFTGSIMPPLDNNTLPLSMTEKMTFVRWIDLGCPINKSHGTEHAAYGWHLDEIRPTLEVSQPRAGLNPATLNTLRIGVADAYTGVNLASLSVTANFKVAGREVGVELSDLLASEGDGVYSMPLDITTINSSQPELYISVADNQGNITKTTRSFSIIGESANNPPNAVIATKTDSMVINCLLDLDGSTSSDSDNDSLTYFWQIMEQPEGSTIILNNRQTSQAQFSADVAGLYQIVLSVSDGSLGDSATLELFVYDEGGHSSNLKMTLKQEN